MFKFMKPGRRYFLINIDEPYIEEIFKALKRGQIEKGEWPEGDIDFTEWKRLTFGCLECPDYRFTHSGGGPWCVAILPDKGIEACKSLVIEEEDERGVFVLVKPPEGWLCPRQAVPAPLSVGDKEDVALVIDVLTVAAVTVPSIALRVPPVPEVETWTQGMIEQAGDWAAEVIAASSDSEVEVRRRPVFLRSDLDFGSAGGERDFIDAELTLDFLLLVGEEEGFEAEIEGWTQEQRQQVIDWAGALHAYASDNPVKVPPKPEFLSGEEEIDACG